MTRAVAGVSTELDHDYWAFEFLPGDFVDSTAEGIESSSMPIAELRSWNKARKR